MTDHAILEERARRLAAPIAEDSDAPFLELLNFTIGDERYAVETQFVRRVAVRPNVTPIPAVPGVFVGVTNLEGEIIPLVNLSQLLGGTRSLPAAPQAIILGRDRAEFAVLADHVESLNIVRDDERIQRTHSLNDDDPIRCVLPDARVFLDGAALIKDRRLTVSRGATAFETPKEIWI